MLPTVPCPRCNSRRWPALLGCDRTPSGILFGKLNDQVDDNLPHSGFANRATAAVTVIPFLCDKFAVPSQNGVRREQCAYFLQAFSSENLAFDGESTTLVVIEQNPFLPQ